MHSQDPPTGKDSEEAGGKVEVLDPSVFKSRGGKRASDKNRDRRKIYQCRECAFYSHRHSNLIRHIKVRVSQRFVRYFVTRPILWYVFLRTSLVVQC